MADSATKTAEEIEAIDKRLFEWVRETKSVLVIAAMLSRDEQSGGIATQPEALIAGCVGAFNEADMAVLLVQIEVAALVLISKMAPESDMGEEAFMRLTRTARRHMLNAEGLGLCHECGG